MDLPQAREQEAGGCVAIDVENVWIKPTRKTFALRAKGDSMIGKHICDGDVVGRPLKQWNSHVRPPCWQQ